MSDAKFEIGQKVVYPSHGVGYITAIESQNISGYELQVYVVSFEKDKMTLRVPTSRVGASGLRKLSSVKEVDKAISTLKSRAKVGRGMWSRRAQEYEGKINSGDIVQIAEVVRDLHKNVDDPDRSYSERIIYESALSRLAGEFAAVQKITHEEANDNLVKLLKVKIAKSSAKKAANSNDFTDDGAAAA